jgi:hypothetical protein
VREDGDLHGSVVTVLKLQLKNSILDLVCAVLAIFCCALRSGSARPSSRDSPIAVLLLQFHLNLVGLKFLFPCAASCSFIAPSFVLG